MGTFPVNRSERQPEARPLKAVNVCENLKSHRNVTGSLHKELSTEVMGSALCPGNEHGCNIFYQLEMAQGALFDH